MKLETKHLPADADAVGYIRQALTPIVAADELELEPGVGPPQGHYSIHIQDELGAPDPIPTLERLTLAIQELREMLEGEPEDEGRSKRRRRRRRRKDEPGKSSPYARSLELQDGE